MVSSLKSDDTSLTDVIQRQKMGLMERLRQYGYYVKCGVCSTNTSMKQPCPACGWKSVRVSKDGPE
ncbi:hypothetical protein HALO32_03555 [Halomonas lysinitropha]|uniref:Uncharacterized protein n=1 Tax=Halomonas lysinitropha TaxID=2607506 RepID=A0A5K1I825_9GAMM|nr:hypothetical protein HALO32_03555 [Halomonas lysinitropha]